MVIASATLWILLGIKSDQTFLGEYTSKDVCINAVREIIIAQDKLFLAHPSTPDTTSKRFTERYGSRWICVPKTLQKENK